MSIISTNPIGIFDSGVGGLTVTHAITQLLPNENIIYFGDTAHLPYGDKSAATIQSYAIKICDILLEQNCKLILIACNSASAAAYDVVKKYVGNKAKVMNVIDPVVAYINKNYKSINIGLIGTKQTVNSKIYQHKVAALHRDLTIQALATPLLVPAIEENYTDNEIIKNIIKKYLSHPNLANIKALILGCTHYPLIKSIIDDFYKGKIDIIDASHIVAKAVKQQLEIDNLLNIESRYMLNFYVSDYTESFAAMAKLFFQEQLHLECYPLWQ